MRVDGAMVVCYIEHMGTKMTLSEAIRSAMKRDGRSLYALANDSGVSRGVVVRFFNGQRDIGLKTADKLFKALGLELKAARRGKAKGG